MNGAPVRGRRMGVDVGAVRVGVALSDPDGILATPLTTLQRDLRKGFDVKLLAGLVQEHGAVAVYVGLPRSLDGGENASTAMARDWAAALVRRLQAKGRPVPVRLVDERLTTVDAHRALLEAGVSRREHMDKVDQVAAATILQSALDRARATGTEPGTPAAGSASGTGPGGVPHNGEGPAAPAPGPHGHRPPGAAAAPSPDPGAPLTTTDPDGEHS